MVISNRVVFMRVCKPLNTSHQNIADLRQLELFVDEFVLQYNYNGKIWPYFCKNGEVSPYYQTMQRYLERLHF